MADDCNAFDKRRTDQDRTQRWATDPRMVLASRFAAIVVLPFIVWTLARLVGQLDTVTVYAAKISENVVRLETRVDNQDRRVDNLERKLFR